MDFYDIFNHISRGASEIIIRINELKTPVYVALGLLSLLTIMCIVIIANQRKLKKELRQLREMLEATSSDEQTND